MGISTKLIVVSKNKKMETFTIWYELCKFLRGIGYYNKTNLRGKNILDGDINNGSVSLGTLTHWVKLKNDDNGFDRGMFVIHGQRKNYDYDEYINSNDHDTFMEFHMGSDKKAIEIMSIIKEWFVEINEYHVLFIPNDCNDKHEINAPTE